MWDEQRQAVCLKVGALRPDANTNPCLRGPPRAAFEKSEFRLGDIQMNSVDDRHWTPGRGRAVAGRGVGEEVLSLFRRFSGNQLKTNESVSLKALKGS